MEALIYEPKIWIALAFVIFMLGFIKYALPFILRGLDNRSAKIKDELDEAVHLREQAQALLNEYQKKQKDMLDEAERLLETAKIEAKNMRKAAEAELKESVERRTRLAHEKIARAEADALADIQSNLVDVAMSAAEKMIAEHYNEQDESFDGIVKDAKRLVH